jgi:hypothetical protein
MNTKEIFMKKNYAFSIAILSMLIFLGACMLFNNAPIADAGTDVTITLGDSIELNASNSIDSDGDPLLYTWRMESAPDINITQYSEVFTSEYSFTPTYAGLYAVSLTVEDEMGKSDTDEIIVSVVFPDFNKSLNLDGIDDYGSIPYSSSMSISDYVTIEALFFLNSLGNDYQSIISQSHSGSQAGNYLLRFNSSEIEFVFQPVSGLDNYYRIDYELPTNTWVHVAIVHEYDSIASTQLYVNGIEQSGSWYDYGNDIYAEEVIVLSQQFLVGHYFSAGDGSEYYFDGSIDELRIWNDLRTETEINQNIARTIDQIPVELIGYWSFEASQNNVVSDNSFNSNDMSFVNGAWIE